MPLPPRSYTTGEKVRRARLLAKGAKGAYGDVSAIEREIDQLDAKAEQRARIEAEEIAKAKTEKMRRKAADKAARKFGN